MPADPMALFNAWFREAEAGGAPQPEAATLHQVRVSGTVRRLTRATSAEYFHSRPRGAQLSALASRQSRVVRSREVLERAVLTLAMRYPEDVPLPRDWGG